MGEKRYLLRNLRMGVQEICINKAHIVARILVSLPTVQVIPNSFFGVHGSIVI